MKIRWALPVMVLVFGLGLTAGRGLSQDAGGEGGEKAPPAGPSAEEMKAWQEFMTPGEEHKALMAQAGEWTVTGKMWMSAEAPPMETAGTSKMKAVMGGRYLMQEYKGVFMGMPFEGLGLTGFDNASKTYVDVWIDNMGTGVMRTEGRKDEKGVIETRGTISDPMGGTVQVRNTGIQKDADHLHIEMFMKGGEHPEEFKVMELEYTRKR